MAILSILSVLVVFGSVMTIPSNPMDRETASKFDDIVRESVIKIGEMVESSSTHELG